MPGLTRRDTLLSGASALLSGSTLPLIGAPAGDLDVPTADIPPPTFKIESGASIRILRPTRFVDADEIFFRANTKKFTEQTGVPVRVSFISWEDLRPQTAVAANAATGPDIIVGFGADPQIYAHKLIMVNDLADYLGEKYGGWHQLALIYAKHRNSTDWLCIPMGGSGTTTTVYRGSWLKQVGYDSVPNDLQAFLTMTEKLNKAGHPVGFALGHAVGDANGFVDWLLWSHGAALTDESGRIALDTPQTVEALEYAQALYPHMIGGTLSWDDTSNNKAFLAGDISMTFNSVSIYYVAKTSKDPQLQAIAADTNHQAPPFGVSPKPPASALVMNAMIFQHTKYPNACKEYLRFMMEAPQYGPWLANCFGYWSNSLKSYGKMPFWDLDPKLKPYVDSMDTPYYDGYKGPITAASSAVTANYTLVDMFASVASGSATPQFAIKEAARLATRFLKE